MSIVEPCLFLINYEMQVLSPVVQLTNSLRSIVDANMIRLAASFNDDNGSIDERVDIVAFDTQFRKSDIEEGVTFSQPDTSISQLFIKSRTVAAATRVWKTSTSDNESGTLNCIYGRDGIPIDENVSLATEISRPRMDRTTVFLAQSSCSQQCRGRNGFTI